jgi:hypothetical protein
VDIRSGDADFGMEIADFRAENRIGSGDDGVQSGDNGVWCTTLQGSYLNIPHFSTILQPLHLPP